MRLSGAIVLLVVLSATAPLAVAASEHGENACTGRITDPADGVTVISVQGARLGGENRGKRPARLVGVGPEGGIEWVHRLGKEHGIVWSYDVDPLPNGNLFGTATRPGKTVFYELDVETGEWVWSTVTNFTDTHDADMLDRHRIVVAHMRNYDEDNETNDDRVLIYNRTSEAVVWQWRFREGGYTESQGGNYSEDWTHVNDVDRIAPGKYLLSPRNLDQVIVLDRESGEITQQLGADGEFETMKQQHNPQYLTSEGGDPTILVADSENDRIVEYERQGGDWERTWELGNSSTLSWPRDADRLPNGNTLVVDSTNHRVIEVTPTGEVVWEFYSPWLVYDAERIRYGDEAGGPTIADQDASGTYGLDGEPRARSNLTDCANVIREFDNDYPLDESTPIEQTATERESTGERRTATETAGESDTATATGTQAGTRTSTPGQAGFGLLLAAFAVLAAGLGWSRRTR